MSSESASPATVRPSGWYWFAFLVAALLAYYTLSGLARDLLYDAVRLSAAAVILHSARRSGGARTGWLLIGVGQLLFALGDLSWDYLKHIADSDPFPSVADVFYLGAYPVIGLGVAALVRHALPGRDRAAVIDAAIVATGVGLVLWVSLVQPYTHDASLTSLERAISTCYPVMDVLLLGMGVRLTLSRGAFGSYSARLWGLGLVALLAADIAFLTTELAGTYQDGTVIDAGFLLAAVLWAAAATRADENAGQPRPARAAEEGPTRMRVVILFSTALIGPVLFAVEAARGLHVDTGATLAGSIALVLLALVRMSTRPVDRQTRRLTLVAAIVGAAVTLALSVVPQHGLRLTSLELRIALETVQALVALLVAYLVQLRFRRTRQSSDALLVTGVALMGMTNVLLAVALGGAAPDSATAFQIWAPLLARLAATITIAAAAWSAGRRIYARAATAGIASAIGGTILVITAVVAAYGDSLPAPRSGSAGGEDLLAVTHPMLVAAQLVLMALFWLSAAGFVYRSNAAPGPLTTALAVGFVLFGFARLNFAVFPSRFTDVVQAGDLLRLTAYLVLLVGAEREIHGYWQRLARVAVSDERERAARELHDGLMQELSFIRSQTAGLTPERADAGVLKQVALAADRALTESRHAVHVLKADGDQDVGQALRRAAEEIATRAGVDVRLDGGTSLPLPAAAVATLSRIVREASSNAVRHGKARRIVVGVEKDRRTLRVSVADDGIGFDTGSIRLASGFGLRNMRDRATRLGGEFTISSVTGQGTTVDITVHLGALRADD